MFAVKRWCVYSKIIKILRVKIRNCCTQLYYANIKWNSVSFVSSSHGFVAVFTIISCTGAIYGLCPVNLRRTSSELVVLKNSSRNQNVDK